MPTPVITFYSYKGGVGRTFALANVAALMARWGHRVLCVDWDLEAPGLHRYFEGLGNSEPHDGLLEWIERQAAGEAPDWRAHVMQLDLNTPDIKGRVDLMPAGNLGPDAGYVSRVQDLDWRRLYDEYGIGDAIEVMRAGWLGDYDYVLVDSRTGITDIGGICAAQLPDILVFVVTANEQSLGGAIDAVERARTQRAGLPLDRGGFMTLPLPSRFDAREEYKLGQQWLGRFAERLAPYYEPWIAADVTPRDLLDVLRIPYLSYWSFGEGIATLEERLEDPENISHSLALVARLLINRLSGSARLLSDRGDAIRPEGDGFDVFVGGYRRSAYPGQLAAALREIDPSIRVWIRTERLRLGDHVQETVHAAARDARVSVYLFEPGDPWADGNQANPHYPLDLSAVREAHKEHGARLIPVHVGDGAGAQSPLYELLGASIREPSPEAWKAVARDIIEVLQ